LKAFLRSSGVQNALASVLSVWLRLCYATIRWEREGEHHARQVWSGDTGAILCLWHCFVPVGPFSWPQGPDRQDMRVLISRSADGELIALTMQKMGLPSIRGSSKKGSAPGKNKHGEQAFRDMIKWVRGGGGIAITPDGPRGPALVMQPGAVTLAKVTGAPVLLLGLACKPCLRARSWDRTVVPLPFSRGVLVWDEPVYAGREDDVDEKVADWTARMNAMTRRAEALLDAPRGE